MIRLHVNQLRTLATRRLPGYDDAVLKLARREGDWLTLTDAQVADIRNRFSAPKLRGLGDAVARVTSAVGIKPCGGCKKRQDALNKLVPFSS